MIFKDLYCSISGISGIQSVTVNQSYGQTTSVATITCESSSLALNNNISIDMGYPDNHTTVFSGRVKNIVRNREDGTISIVAKDILIDAVDFFLVADNPDEPFKFNNISAENLVGSLLSMAGLTNYSAVLPLSFTFAINAPAEFNLVSVMDAVNQIANILAWHVFADGATVKFRDIRPYFRTGAQKDIDYGQSGNADDVTSHTICNDGSLVVPGVKKIIKTISRTISDEGIRNKVVVYGREGVKAKAKTSSPYLPANFYKAAVIASPLIDSQSMAQAAADYNLKLFNRLTDTVETELMGDPTIKARQFILFSDDYCEINDADLNNRRYFVQSCQHTMGNGGFTTRLSCSK